MAFTHAIDVKVMDKTTHTLNTTVYLKATDVANDNFSDMQITCLDATKAAAYVVGDVLSVTIVKA